MEECEDNLSAEEIQNGESSPAVRIKPKKRSLVERELETNMTARVTSPVTGEGASTSRYGRARRPIRVSETEVEKVMKPLKIDTKPQPQAYKMHASNSPIRKDSPNRPISIASTIEDQIENIYNENMALSRFGSEELLKRQSPAKKFPKVYIRKDLTQKPEPDDIVLIKNLFSPAKSNTHLNNILERSTEKYSLNGQAAPRNGFPDTSSVVKTLDFDGKKKKKEVREKAVSKNELFELEAGCEYQVGDLAWARVGTYPFWPCIITREPFTDMFVKKKLFGRVEHDIIHVTFFGDNGRRGWIVDNMLRKYSGRAEFETAKEKFTPEAKKKDPRFYAAFFVSEKKLPQWNVSVEEAEAFLREPKRLRIDILHDMLGKARSSKTTPKREKGGKITRTDSDVSLSESLYDTLFSEDDNKNDDKNSKLRKKSLDVSEVVTACLDNMAAKSGITKIQKQSHMDRWLQKAKSKTPEKSQPKLRIKNDVQKKRDRVRKPKESRKSKLRKNESLSSDKTLLPYQNEHDYSSVNYENHDGSNINTDFDESGYNDTLNSTGMGMVAKVESLSSMDDCSQEDIITTVVNDDIVITDAENISKEIKVVDGSDNDKIIIKEEETKVTSVEDNVSSMEENLAKDQRLKVEVPKVDNIQTRNSKRKPQTVHDINITIIVEATSVESSTETEEKLAKDEILEDVVPKTEGIDGNKTDNIQTRHSKKIQQSVDANDDKIITNNVDKSKVTSVENIISSTVIEDKQTKDEPLKVKVPKTDGIKSRHSLRKSQSVDANDDKLITNTVEKTMVSTINEEKQTKDEPLKVKVPKSDGIKTRHSKRKSQSTDANDDDKIIKKDVEETMFSSDEHSISSTGTKQKQNKDEPLKIEVSQNSGIQIRRNKSKPQSVDTNDDKNIKNLEEIKVSSVENNISHSEFVEKLTKNEPLKAEVPKTDVIQTRHSKRKSQSVDTNDDKINTKDTETKVTSVENNISSTEIEQKESKDEKTKEESLKVKLLKTDVIQTRRSKRKRQSLEDKNYNIVENKAKNAKLDLEEFKVAMESKITETGSEDLEKKVKAVVNNSQSVIADMNTMNTTSILEKTDAWYQNKLLPINGPKPVVIIKPLKMIGMKHMTKDITQRTDVENDGSLLKNNDKMEIGEMAVIEKTSVKHLEIGVSKEIILVSEKKVDHNGSNTIIDGESIMENDKNSNKEITKDILAQNRVVCNGISHSPPQENSITNKLDVDNHEILNTKKIKNAEVSSDLSNTKLQPDNEDAVDTQRNEIVSSPKLESENKEDLIKKDTNEGTSVVIGEEMYVFDRTLSQDYDEIYEDNINDIDTPPVLPETTAEDCSGSKNDTKDLNEKVSQDYDEVIENTNHYNHSEMVEKAKVDLNDFNSEERNDTLTDKIHEDTSSNDVTENKIVNKVDGHTETDKEKEGSLDIEDNSKLTNDEDSKDLLNDQDSKPCDLKNEIAEKHHDVEEKDENFDEPLRERKEKNLKSPRLSLNRVKRTSTKPDLKLPKNISENNITESDTIAVRIELNNDTNSENHINITETEDSNVAVKTDSNNPTDDVFVDTQAKKDTKINGYVENKESSPERKLRDEIDLDTVSIKSEDSGVSITRRKIRSKDKQSLKKAMDDPEFMKYLEFRQDALIDEQPELTQDEIVTYLYQTWLYEESNKSDMKKTDEAEQSNIVKGLNTDPAPQPKKIKKKPKVEKEPKLDKEKEPNVDIKDISLKEKPKRKITQTKPYYNEDFSDLEEEDLETFSIFDTDVTAKNEDGEPIDEVELYFEKLPKPKPNVFKGYVRERVCEICERTENLVKCKACHGMFHVECVQKEVQIVEVPAPTRGRKKKKKTIRGRKPKGYEDSIADSGSQSDEKSQDANNSEELNVSLEDELESHITFDADYFETQWEVKIKEVLPETVEGDFVSDQEIIWDAPPGQCEIVEMKHKEKQIDYSDFKCKDCQKHETPVCFVCKSDTSTKGVVLRQKCQFAHCHRYYHLECLEYWPQTQFNSWEPSKTNKKVIEYVEALSCPRHVCHTCVSDDPRGCKTRFCGDKLARCVRCPATYHSFTKCLPAGTQILTASQIICPRHYEHRPGKVPCHVNTGWCFICALGGTLICCEYCPTSFHAECLNIKPPEGNYMCEDCETGRLPLYGEMVWVKLGHYRWWPGIILHPTEIPDNIMAVKHSPGEFVVRFFGQYDHYWVNRGRVFPFQEGDSGKISSQKSKIDAAFTTAMEHAQRACEILKNIEPNEEEDLDIASSLLPPHYVKLKVNKPVGPLVARRDVDSNSLTQCECDVSLPEPCGIYSHCLNRMLLTECGPLCRAGDRCNNRAFEKRLYPRLAAARTSARGWGLKTLEDIKQGQFVIEYVGELIDEEEFRRRMCRKHEIRDENYYFLTLDKERMIDAGPKGNLARFMNHCCEPNCETQKWTVLGDVRVGLFALRDIPANSELTFNYNLECTGIEKKRCLCGAKRCSGYIGAKPKQEEAQPKKTKAPGKRTYKKRKNFEDSPSTSKIKPPIKIKIKPIKPRELTEIEKDLLIIKNATNGMSSDSEGSRLSSVDEKKDTKPLKRKRVSFSSEDVPSCSVKKTKLDDKVGD